MRRLSMKKPSYIFCANTNTLAVLTQSNVMIALWEQPRLPGGVYDRPCPIVPQFIIYYHLGRLLGT